MHLPPTREEALASPIVHKFTKEILYLSTNKDIVDRVCDAELALEILKKEMNDHLNSGGKMKC